MKKVRIGSGAGYSGDRIEPAVELAQKGDIQYLIFECLAERTIAIAQQNRMKNPNLGYDALLEARMEAVLPICREKGIKIITNMGAANPVTAMKKTLELAKAMGIKGLKVAAVTGDEVLDQLKQGSYTIMETGNPLENTIEKVVSANAYLGVQPIVDALKNDADVIITGRVADPALVLAPLIYEFNWSDKDWDKMGQGTVIGHLLECAGQVTGGYFADPGYKDVAGLARLGFPIAEVREDGQAVITKVPGSGGQVTLATCKEQLLYEIHDPAAYITPDVVADFTNVTFTRIGPDQVLVSGGKGKPHTEYLKVSIGYIDSYVGEGQISYAGPGAVSRGRLALDIVQERLKLMGVLYQELKCDLIGIDSLHGESLSKGMEPYEVRVRVIGRTEKQKEAVRIGNEVETLYTNGPAGGGGATKTVRDVVAIVSTLMPRQIVSHTNYYEVI